MKTTRNELVELYAAMTEAGQYFDVKFNYAIGRNLHNINTEIKLIEKAKKDTPATKLYEIARVTLCVKMARKDDQNLPIITKLRDGKSEYDMEDRTAFDSALETLKSEHKEAIDYAAVQESEYQCMMAEEIDFDIFTVSNEYLPEKITGNDYR